MATFKQKHQIWLTLFLVYLGSSLATPATTNQTHVTMKAASRPPATNATTNSAAPTSASPISTNPSRASPSTQITSLRDTKTSTPEATQSSAVISTKTTTTTTSSTVATTKTTTTTEPATTASTSPTTPSTEITTSRPTTTTTTTAETTSISTSHTTESTLPSTESLTINDDEATSEAPTSTVATELSIIEEATTASPSPTTTPTTATPELSTAEETTTLSVTKEEEEESTALPSPTTTPITTTTEIDYCVGVTCENNGTCNSSHHNFTCACEPGWQGPLCHEEKHYCDSIPCQNSGTCTQNLTLAPDYFSCNCTHGFTGPTCAQDIHECDNATICGTGVCAELPGCYRCICPYEWTGTNCETDVNECDSQGACPENYHCNNTEGGHDCICDDPLEYIDHLCQRKVLWPDFKIGSEFTTQTVYNVRTAIPFPYFDSASRELFVYRYGYVAFGGNILRPQAPYVPAQWPYSTKLFGVYWADITATDNSQNPSHFYLSLDEGRLTNVSYTSSLIDYVKNVIKSDFEPLSVLAATWVNAVPNPAKDFPKDNATFQVIFATDGHLTYAITGYRTVWQNTNVYNRPFVKTAHSLTNGVQSNDTRPDSGTGPVVEKLVAHQVSDPRSFECVRETQEARVRYSEDLRSLPPCPCYKIQADNDERFEVSTKSSACYESTVPSPENSLNQLCCFDVDGLLDNNILPTPVDTNDNSLSEAVKTCCDILGLCGWFTTQISVPGCGEYIPPFVGGGFGDPHILTFDGNKYSFNGLGDFVIFKSGDAEFQGRTDISSNNYTTVFVAYALKVGNTTYKFYPENVLVRLDNGITNETLAEAKVVTSNIVVKVRNENATLSYKIKLLSNSFSDSQGLMGHADVNASNDFRFQNGTLIEGTTSQLSADIINQFGESWRANESLLGDEIDYPNFTSPVLETTPDAVLKQIFAQRNQTARDDAENICKGELFCLQDFLIEGDPDSARDTLKDANEISDQDILNQLPKFQNTLGYLQVNVSFVLNLTLEASSPEANVSVPSTHFSELTGFKFDGKQLSWNISADLEALRNASYPKELKFSVTNEHHLSAEYSPIISLCLCEKSSQCSLEPEIYDDNGTTDPYFLRNDGITKGNVGIQTCDCRGRAEGQFCEQKINVCENCFVKNETLCNTTLEDYCPPCPAGHAGNRFLCPDINECDVDNGGCKHVCNNVDGGFYCGCHENFKLSRDGKSCLDINECLDKSTCGSSKKYCINEPGSYRCVCYPGLVGDDECILAPYTFYGSLGLKAINDQKMSYALLVKSSPEFQKLAKSVSNAITNVLIKGGLFKTEELYVEVLSFQNETAKVTTGRARRDTSTLVEAYTLVHYLIHSTNESVSGSAINAVLTSGLGGCNTSCQFEDLLLFPGTFPAVEEGKDLCDHEEVHHCDPLTTDCDSDDRVTQCDCKSGYARYEMNLFSCYDIDECSNNATLCGPAKGACINRPGGYECDCGKGKLWNKSTKTCVGDKCSKNPCENDGLCFISNNDQGFVCSCTYGWNGPVCGDEDTDARRMKIAVICVGAILGFCCLALFIIVVVVCLKQRRISKETSQSGHYSEIRSTSHAKVAQRDSNEMEENGRGNVYTHPSFERTSDKRTSFHSPIPETKKEANSKVYYNKAFSNDVVERL